MISTYNRSTNRQLFPVRTIEKPAMVILSVPTKEGDFRFTLSQIDKRFARVVPSTWQEICFIRSLDHGHNVFAPWDGDGVLVMEEFLPLL
jgi:hypothetical protein